MVNGVLQTESEIEYGTFDQETEFDDGIKYVETENGNQEQVEVNGVIIMDNDPVEALDAEDITEAAAAAALIVPATGGTGTGSKIIFKF